MPDPATLRVAMIGHGFMGAVHSHAWRSAGHIFDLPRTPELSVLVGRDLGSTTAAAAKMGWREAAADWREVVSRRDIDVVDVCTPGDLHAKIAIAALQAGKHVFCEKPLASTVEQAESMVAAADTAGAGVRSMVGFNYRRVPAVAPARAFAADGRIGAIRHVRATYLQEWLVDPSAPLTWRLQRERAGSGALGDLGSHLIDIVQFVTGELLSEVSGQCRTFVDERPLASPNPGSPGGARRGAVTVDDAASFLGRFAGGALATLEATRFASGARTRCASR